MLKSKLEQLELERNIVISSPKKQKINNLRN
jgi:hypothetical protein